MLSNYVEKYWAVDDRTDQERTFTIYTRSGSFLVIDDKGNEGLAGPDSGLNKYDILRDAKPPIV
jgi:hypothetical protein